MASLKQMWKNKNDNHDKKALFFSSSAYEWVKYYIEHASHIDKSIILKYGSRELDTECFDSSYDYEVLREFFNSFIITNGENMERIFNAIKLEYIPINNYDKTSTITTEYQGRESDFYHTGTKTVTNTDSRNTYDNDDFTEVNASEMYAQASTDSNTKEFDDRMDVVTEHTYGNVGVTKSDELLSDFINLRKFLDFYNMVFETFLFEYTW